MTKSCERCRWTNHKTSRCLKCDECGKRVHQVKHCLLYLKCGLRGNEESECLAYSYCKIGNHHERNCYILNRDMKIYQKWDQFKAILNQAVNFVQSILYKEE